MSRVKYTIVTGREVPKRAKKLTRGDNGVMLRWYEQDRDKMHATLLFHKDRLIGWCAVNRIKFLWFNTKKFYISTYVQPYKRGKGYAKELLESTLKFVKSIEPKAQILYGTPSDHKYFNEKYVKSISSVGLKPNRYFCKYEE